MREVRAEYDGADGWVAAQVDLDLDAAAVRRKGLAGAGAYRDRSVRLEKRRSERSPPT